MKAAPVRPKKDDGEFLWLVSLSDLMILLFIFFVVLFSFSFKKMTQEDLKAASAALKNEKPPPKASDQIAQQMKEWVEQAKLTGQIEVKKEQDDVLIEIKDRVFFASAAFLPHQEGLRIIRLISTQLQKVPQKYKIGIEGHTDDSPIHSEMVQDNWELSTRRALSILYSLGMPADQLKRTVLLAYGEMKPIAPNRTPAGAPDLAGQSKNRRVTIRIFQ